ncbi:hypothetical protein PybrP1_003336 [[Pythium] brassicae (nom. inval.)]|nr:hypothetical protein PybrP1_003336 [[Pythium] brassicae (nom. inval.)]
MDAALQRKELDARLGAYLPAVVRRHLERQLSAAAPPRLPDTQEVTAVSMFADVSGFTAMTESLAARGPVGAELLAKHLNSYFEQLLRLVSSAGGDVFKFAGDAMLIFWPENKDDTLASLLRRALQCALRIQAHLHRAELAPGVVLSVKMGVGIGGATIAHLGGSSDGSVARVEYVAVGPALQQAFDAEHQAQAGEVVCSPACWRIVREFFDGESVRSTAAAGSSSSDDDGGGGFWRVRAVTRPVKLCSRRPSFTRDDALLHTRMKQYVSRAVWPYLDAHDEFWGSELRDVTVLFINLGFWCCVYEYEGTINKFLVDDKGSTVLAAFGLPPVTHENDPVRGILASLAICAALGALELKASVGITTGTALCGVVGHQGNRREYTVLGDVVNLSARLMQRAKSENGGVITDEATKLLSHDVLHFEERPEIMVKGKNDSIKIHRPYPRMSILLEFHLSTTRASRRPGGGGASRPTQIPNVMANMHRVQVRDAQRRLSVRADRESAAAAGDRIIESDSFRRVRAALLDKCSELNPFSPGGSFVLEGDIGVGKTVLLRAALNGPEASAYNVLHGTTTPFATRKPYAIWANLIAKCALDQVAGADRGATPKAAHPSHGFKLPSSPKHHSSSSSSNGHSHAPPLTEVSKEAERRKQVALFVRRKIKEGAAPNTTLVGYAKLLNAILDTDFEEFTRDDAASDERASAAGRSIKLLESGDVWGSSALAAGADTRRRDASNQEVEAPPPPPPPQQQSSAGQMDGPSKLKLKEEEIAAWFLGLLEMDLARSRCNSDDLRMLAPLDNPSASSSAAAPLDEAAAREAELEEWTPSDLDLSGILLLCALHAVSRGKATVFCLDNAMHMDDKSWVLVTIVAKYFTNCLVVVGTRPPSLARSENTESSSFRTRLHVLKRMRSCVRQALEPLGEPELEQLALQTLSVHAIPAELLAILVSRSQGNPLFLRELIAEMLQQQVIKVDSRRRTCQMHVQEPWGDKSSASYCFYCHTKLSASKDKHRCKCCGHIFCAPCTPSACRKKIPGVRDDLVRHCCGCYTLASTRRPSSDPSLAAAVAASATGAHPTFNRQKSRMRSLFYPSSASSGASSGGASSETPPQALKHRIALRPPRTVKSVLTTLLDQLSVSQRMLLKTASVIGAVFDDELLRRASPILAHLSRFALDMDELERLAMIRRVDTACVGGPAPLPPPSRRLKTKFEFAHGFLQDVLRSQMLCSQLDKLSTRVADCREQQHKQLRLAFFEKANGSLGRLVGAAVAGGGGGPHHHPQLQLELAIDPRSIERRRGSTPAAPAVAPSTGLLWGGRRALTPTDGRAGSRFFARSPSQADSSGGSSSSATQLVLDDDDKGLVGVVLAPVPVPPPAFVLLKAGSVHVKKQSSVFAHLKLKGLANARLWKKRFAVLQSERLVLQHDEPSSRGVAAGAAAGVLALAAAAAVAAGATTAGGAASPPQGRQQGTLLSLKGAKVGASDPEVAGKVHCFQLEVREWAKGKHVYAQRRTVVLDAQSDKEVGDWVFMIRYAIESLENQAAAAAAAAAVAADSSLTDNL